MILWKKSKKQRTISHMKAFKTESPSSVSFEVTQDGPKRFRSIAHSEASTSTSFHTDGTGRGKGGWKPGFRRLPTNWCLDGDRQCLSPYYFCLGYSQESQRKFHALQETRSDPSLWCSVGRHGPSWSPKFDFRHPSKSAKRDCLLRKRESPELVVGPWQVAAAAIIFKMEAWWKKQWQKPPSQRPSWPFGVRSTKTKSTKSWNLQESSAPWNEKERHRPKASILWVPSISWESKGTSLVATPPFKTILPP